MIKKVARKISLTDNDNTQQDLEYWLSRPPTERVAAVDFLREQYYGKTERIKKVVRIVKLK